ncbi:hypothetical protein Ancab_035368, partial [Ancistrocladus abbreviatus]
MEEVWKDISLSAIYPPTSTAKSHHVNFHSSYILQDFLSLQAEKDPPPISKHSPFSALPPPPATCLSLKSGQLDSESNPGFLSSFDHPFKGLGSSCSLLGSFCNKKRESEESDGSGDRRRKRMMKNRESAAYKLGLERKRSYLMEENARLRRKLQDE